MTQLQVARSSLYELLVTELEEMKGLKFMETLVVTFEKELNDNFTYKTAYFNSKTKTITTTAQFVLEGGNFVEQVRAAQEEILHTVGVWISEGSGWTIDSVGKHYVNISKYQPLRGSSYLKLPEELQNPRKGLVNIKNIDNECFR